MISKYIQSCKVAFRVAWLAYRQCILDPRIFLLGILCIFSKTMVSDVLIQQSEAVGTPLHFLEPFIAMGNSGVLVLFFPFVFLILMSDFPVTNASTLFLLKRTGKKAWFWGQLIFLGMIAITFLLTMVGVGCFSVIRHAQWSMHWSDAVTKYNAMFPENANGFTFQFLPSNLYNQLSICEAFWHTFFLMALYFILLAMILMLMKLLLFKTAGLLFDIAIIGTGTAVCAVRLPIMWCFPMANSIIWQHYLQITSEPIYPLRASYCYFVVGISILVCCSRIILHRTNAIGIGG